MLSALFASDLLCSGSLMHEVMQTGVGTIAGLWGIRCLQPWLQPSCDMYCNTQLASTIFSPIGFFHPRLLSAIRCSSLSSRYCNNVYLPPLNLLSAPLHAVHLRVCDPPLALAS